MAGERLKSVSPATMKTPQAAGYLGFQTSTLETWRWSGKGPRFCRLGKSVRYRQSDLDEFLESHSSTSTGSAQAAEQGGES